MKTDWKAFLAEAGAEFEAEQLLHFGNPGREQQVVLNGLTFTDIDYMGVIAVHGTEAGSFLQSQFSNDVSLVSETRSQLNSYNTPKGRMLGLMRVFRQGDTYYLRLPEDTLEAVLQRLRMFVMRADVTLEDVSDSFVRIGISGEQAAEELEDVVGALPLEIDAVTQSADVTLLRVPGVQPRYEAYIRSLEMARRVWDTLNVRGAPVAESAWRLLEIMAGIPAVFAATSELFVAQMANLQLVNGVSFKKGCYPGQEIVARMEYLGTLKRRMYLGRIETDQPVSPADSLYTSENGEQAVGRIVDGQPHPDGGQQVLAILQIKAAEAADLHHDSQTGAVMKLESLPYPFESSEPLE